MDYFDAEDECKSMNSSIVYIENEAELDFLLSMIYVYNKMTKKI